MHCCDLHGGRVLVPDAECGEVRTLAQPLEPEAQIIDSAATPRSDFSTWSSIASDDDALAIVAANLDHLPMRGGAKDAHARVVAQAPLIMAMSALRPIEEYGTIENTFRKAARSLRAPMEFRRFLVPGRAPRVSAARKTLEVQSAGPSDSYFDSLHARHLYWLFRAAGWGLLKDARVASAWRMTRQRFLSAGKALGCSEAALRHYWQLVGDYQYGYLIECERKDRSGTEWKEAKGRFGPRKGFSERLSYGVVLSHLCELESVSARFGRPDATDPGYQYIAAFDVDCHPASIEVPGLLSELVETRARVGRRQLEACDRESVLDRISLLRRAMRCEPSLITTSPRGYHVRFLLPMLVPHRLFKQWVEERLRDVGTQLAPRWIELPERLRLPLGKCSRIVGPDLELLFNIDEGLKGRELEHLMKVLPLPTPENAKRDLSVNSVPEAWLVRELERLESGSKRRRKRSPPDRGRSGRRFPKEWRSGITGPGQTNKAVLALTRWFMDAEGLQPDAAAEALFTWFEQNSNGRSNDFERNPDAFLVRLRLAAWNWKDKRANTFVGLDEAARTAASAKERITKEEALLVLKLQRASCTQEQMGSGDLKLARLIGFIIKTAKAQSAPTSMSAAEFTMGADEAAKAVSAKGGASKRMARTCLARILDLRLPDRRPLLELLEAGEEGVKCSRYRLNMELQAGGTFRSMDDAVAGLLGEDGVRARYRRSTAKILLERCR